MMKCKILVMCGGRGRRLGKLTKIVPKPLVKINTEKTILEVKIEEYILQGHKEMIFCTGYKGDLIRELVCKYQNDIKAEFSDAGEDAGILERLFHARDLIQDQVLMTYGDTYTNMNLNDFFAAHTKSDTEATIVTAPIQNPFGLVEFDKDNKVTLFKEKPVLNYYIGNAVINKSALDFASEGIVKMPDGQGLVTFYKILGVMNKLGSYPYNGPQITFNTPDELKLARKEIGQFYTTPEVANDLEE